MTTINFQTSNLIIACYIPGAGGKFILNCLGLSRHVVLQDQELAQHQLNNQLSPKDKHALLLERITDTDQTWSDLGLGCRELFGDAIYNNKKNCGDFKFAPVIAELSNSNLKFCLVSHEYPRVANQLKVWANAHCIIFTDEIKFIQTVRSASNWSAVAKWSMPTTAIDLCWTNIRGDSWPEIAPKNLQEYDQLPKFIKDEIAELHENIILKHYRDQDEEKKVKQDVLKKHQCQTWNCNWFLDRELFLIHMKNLYNSFNLDDFNDDLVMSLYDAWVDKLNIINKHRGFVQ